MNPDRKPLANIPVLNPSLGLDPEAAKGRRALFSEWNWNRRTAKGLAANLTIALVLVLVANGLIFALNPESASSAASSPLNPPGWLVGAVWVLLFEAMAAARWFVLGRDDRRIRSSTWILLLVLFCLAYPVYTLGLRSLAVGLIGDIATFAVALWVALRVYRASRLAAGLVSLVAAWVAFATLVVILQIQGTLS